MPRKAEVLNSLSRGRVRASWNKYNLFNLYKKGRVGFQGQNLYQQKWTAKQETRAYHGEHMTEKRFQADFSQKLESVAHLDASLRGENNITTPVPLQTYAVLEKRLDFAVFRSMFASSIRHARQFILHGYVQVNGIRIRQPGYTLAPGDIFSVKPEKVLTALGATKPSVKQATKVDNVQISKWNEYVSKAKNNPKAVWDAQSEKKKLGKELDEEEEKAMRTRVFNFNNKLEAQMLKAQKEFTKSKVLKDVLSLGIKTEVPTVATFDIVSGDAAEKALKLFQKAITAPGFDVETLKTKSEKEIEALVFDALNNDKQAARSDSEKKVFSEIKQLVASVQSIHWEDLRKASEARKIDANAKEIPYDPEWANKLSFHQRVDTSKALENESSVKVDLPWQKGLFGRQEPSKPYFTPWKVRPFIAPFAILPSHIEISFETCHAVYLRDPVALPGKSEVISPFGLPVHQRAYMWYTRRVKVVRS
jgi:ribosomal protein S4